MTEIIQLQDFVVDIQNYVSSLSFSILSFCENDIEWWDDVDFQLLFKILSSTVVI